MFVISIGDTFRGRCRLVSGERSNWCEEGIKLSILRNTAESSKGNTVESSRGNTVERSKGNTVKTHIEKLIEG